MRPPIVVDREHLGGQPCPRGLPVTVAEIVQSLRAGRPLADVLALHPELTEADVGAALVYSDGGPMPRLRARPASPAYRR